MFQKKRRKTVSEANLLPSSQRVWIILQLCLVFCVVLSNLSLPFLHNMYESKRTHLLLHYLKENPEFDELKAEEKNFILNFKNEDLPFTTKLKASLQVLFVEMPLAKRAWIALSFAICILLLLRYEGASKAAWLIPLVVLVFAIYNIVDGTAKTGFPDENLFPTEQQVISFLDKPLSQNIEEQRTELLNGWNKYLIKHWLKEAPEPELFEIQVKKAEYQFHLERLKLLEKPSGYSLNEKEPLFLLFCYLVWNLLFTLGATGKLRLK